MNTTQQPHRFRHFAPVRPAVFCVVTGTWVTCVSCRSIEGQAGGLAGVVNLKPILRRPLPELRQCRCRGRRHRPRATGALGRATTRRYLVATKARTLVKKRLKGW